MERYKLIVVVPSSVETYDEELNKFLAKLSYDKHIYLPNTAPPVRREIHFRNITEFQVDALKTWFKSKYSDHPQRNVCAFHLMSESGDVV